MSDVTIHKTATLKMKKPLVILGFPGTGLVGSVAASQIIEDLELEFGGYISSPEFAPLAAIHDYVPFPAARIHFSKKHNLVVIISEMNIPNAATLDLSDKLFKFAKSLKASTIISLGGIAANEGKNDVYMISSDGGELKRLVKKKVVKPIKEGATTGVTGVLLTRGTLDDYPVTTLLAEASEDFVDAKAASNVIKALSKMTGMKISTTTLDKEARTKNIGKDLAKSKISKKGPRSGEGGHMYG
jgi:uncharacterized protein